MSMLKSGLCWAAAAMALIAPLQQAAIAQPPAWPVFVTLGTNGGPIPLPNRSEPSNALIVGADAYLVDVGDGAAEQLAKAGIRIPQVKAVFISHLHFDHIGGLSALIGLRHQADVPGALAIYGPPGTKQFVAGLIASMAPSARAGYGVEGEPYVAPASTVSVVELGDGNSVNVGPMTVSTRQNTHYSFKPGSEMDKRYKSLSFRFDFPGRAIVYTGDTGPSPAVEELARGADLLISEMIDVPMTLSVIQKFRMTKEAANDQMVEHFDTQHLTAENVGELAGKAKVGALVITHFVAPMATGSDILRYESEIGRHYSGPIVVASDLDRF